MTMTRKLMKKIIMSALLMALSPMTMAATTYVYCASHDSKDWGWLYYEDGRDWEVTGRWESAKNMDGSWFGYFVIDDYTFNTLVIQCDFFNPNSSFTGWDPHPADSATSKWYLFKNDMTQEFSRGYYTRFNGDPFGK